MLGIDFESLNGVSLARIHTECILGGDQATII